VRYALRPDLLHDTVSRLHSNDTVLHADHPDPPHAQNLLHIDSLFPPPVIRHLPQAITRHSLSPLQIRIIRSTDPSPPSRTLSHHETRPSSTQDPRRLPRLILLILLRDRLPPFRLLQPDFASTGVAPHPERKRRRGHHAHHEQHGVNGRERAVEWSLGE
jgi:hypothetical protein